VIHASIRRDDAPARRGSAQAAAGQVALNRLDARCRLVGQHDGLHAFRGIASRVAR
jgi:hypothetical protein